VGRHRLGHADVLEDAHHFVVEREGARPVVDAAAALDRERAHAEAAEQRAQVAPTGPSPITATSKL
jgi:hypothetical protein